MVGRALRLVAGIAVFRPRVLGWRLFDAKVPTSLLRLRSACPEPHDCWSRNWGIRCLFRRGTKVPSGSVAPKVGVNVLREILWLGSPGGRQSAAQSIGVRD